VLALFVAGVVVVLGAYTRLVHAGLGCPDWPTCYGHIWVPSSDADVARANERFAGTPVEHDKTWPEQIHRIFASSLGLLILVIFFFSMKYRHPQQSATTVIFLLGVLVLGTVLRIFTGDVIDFGLMALVALYFINLIRISKVNGGADSLPFKLSSLLAGLVILQGLFGMWTVTLKLWPQVVTAHLLGGFCVLSLIWLLIQRLGGFGWTLDANAAAACLRLRLVAMVTLVLVVLQIALGAWTSSNYAALACPDFPLCQTQLFPPVDIAQGFNFFQHVGPNYLGGLMENDARVAIHLSHRIGAIVVTVAVIMLIMRLWSLRVKQARNLSRLLSAALILQVGLGVSNIVFGLPLWVAVAHNAGGALLLLLLVMVNHRLRTVKTE